MSAPIRVSASRLQTLKDCSMLFWYQEICKLPQSTHHKTRQGSCVHSIAECLLTPKRAAALRAILREGFSFALCPAIKRFILSYDAKHGIAPYDMDAMEDMLKVLFLTIKTHFDAYFAALDAGQPAPFRYYIEKRFQIQIGDATISGFIDLLLIWPDRALVIDYKSKAKKWTVAEVPNNVQAALYQRACYHEFNLIPDVDFVMVRHMPSKRYPKLHLQSVAAPSIAHLIGLEVYISKMYGSVNQFTLEDALAHPHCDEGFCLRVCGFHKPFSYWARVKKTTPTEVIETYLDGKQPINVAEDESLLIKQHPGCMIKWHG